MESLERRLDRALALAGVMQAAFLVKQLAWKGAIDSQEFNTAIHSIFQTDPENVVAVYENTGNLRTGLQTLVHLLSDVKSTKDPEIARYAISMLHLERFLIKKSDMLNQIQKGVERAKNQALHFSPTHENVIANLASVYTDTLSTFKFRVHVSGESSHLSKPQIINKVRALLLAGIRSAVLWRQLGGSRWQLVLGKKALLQDTKLVLSRIKSHETEDSLA
jgi:high frequency lysogenization protein